MCEAAFRGKFTSKRDYLSKDSDCTLAVQKNEQQKRNTFVMHSRRRPPDRARDADIVVPWLPDDLRHGHRVTTPMSPIPLDGIRFCGMASRRELCFRITLVASTKVVSITHTLRTETERHETRLKGHLRRLETLLLRRCLLAAVPRP